MEQVLSVQSLTKYYGLTLAVDDLSFTVVEGEIFGLLGSNGAGKTTTLEATEGLPAPDRGGISVLGINPVKDPGGLYQVIGVQLQVSALPDSISVGEAMSLMSAYHHVEPRPAR